MQDWDCHHDMLPSGVTIRPEGYLASLPGDAWSTRKICCTSYNEICVHCTHVPIHLDTRRKWLLQVGGSYIYIYIFMYIYIYMSMEFMWIKCLMCYNFSNPGERNSLQTSVWPSTSSVQVNREDGVAEKIILRTPGVTTTRDALRSQVIWLVDLEIHRNSLKKSQGYSSSHNHGSGEWVPTRLVSSIMGPFSTSIIRVVKSKSRLFLDSLIIFFYELFMISLWLPFMILFMIWFIYDFLMIISWFIYDFFMISRKFHEIPKENSKNRFKSFKKSRISKKLEENQWKIKDFQKFLRKINEK